MLWFQRDAIARLQPLPGVIGASPADGMPIAPAPSVPRDLPARRAARVSPLSALRYE
jgi:hypothetical protein